MVAEKLPILQANGVDELGWQGFIFFNTSHHSILALGPGLVEIVFEYNAIIWRFIVLV